MTRQTLNANERKALEHRVTETKDAQQWRRAQALLWLNQGDPVPEVADRLCRSRQVIYKWVAQFYSRQALEIAQRVAPGARSGRPRTAHGIIDPLIVALIERAPGALGYRSTVWTAPLLPQYLWEEHALTVSRQSVSRAMARSGFEWKRPRHRLARRPTTWRQAQGGSNPGSATVSVPSC
jgi:transposase